MHRCLPLTASVAVLHRARPDKINFARTAAFCNPYADKLFSRGDGTAGAGAGWCNGDDAFHAFVKLVGVKVMMSAMLRDKVGDAVCMAAGLAAVEGFGCKAAVQAERC